jgi:hypothetical protein
MNENIQKLCKELLHYDDMIFGWRETVERAAEAIVMECCEQARDEVQSILDWDKADQVVVRIKEHFGVTK